MAVWSERTPADERERHHDGPGEVVAVKPGTPPREVGYGDAHFRMAKGASQDFLDLMLADPKPE